MAHVGDCAQRGRHGGDQDGAAHTSFLPGCHMVGSRRGTREVSQRGSRGI